MWTYEGQSGVAAMLLLVLIILEGLGGLAFIIFLLIQFSDEYLSQAVLFLIILFYLCYSTIDGVVQENKFELLGFICSNLILLGISIYFFVDSKKEDWQIGIFCCFCFCSFWNVFLSFWIYNSFGWKLFKKIGADVSMNKMYRNYQVFVTLLKLDLMLEVLGVTAVALYYFRLFEVFVLIGCLLLSIGWALIGWFGVRLENKIMVGIFFLFALIEPAYIIAKFIFVFLEDSNQSHYQSVLFVPLIVIGAFAVLVRMSLMAFAILALHQFNRGLRQKVFVVEEMEHQVPFLTA